MRDRTQPMDMKALMEEAAGQPVPLPWGPIRVLNAAARYTDLEDWLNAQIRCRRCYPTYELHVLSVEDSPWFVAVVMHYHAD